MNINDHNKYVGALILDTGLIVTDKKLISAAIKLNSPIYWISKAQADFMSECDFGSKWKALAESPIILEDKKGVMENYQKAVGKLLAANFGREWS